MDSRPTHVASVPLARRNSTVIGLKRRARARWPRAPPAVDWRRRRPARDAGWSEASPRRFLERRAADCRNAWRASVRTRTIPARVRAARDRRLGEAVCGAASTNATNEPVHPVCHLRHLRFLVSHRSDANRAIVTSSEASSAYRIGVTAIPLTRYSSRWPFITTTSADDGQERLGADRDEQALPVPKEHHHQEHGREADLLDRRRQQGPPGRPAVGSRVLAPECLAIRLLNPAPLPAASSRSRRARRGTLVRHVRAARPGCPLPPTEMRASARPQPVIPRRP